MRAGAGDERAARAQRRDLVADAAAGLPRQPGGDEPVTGGGHRPSGNRPLDPVQSRLGPVRYVEETGSTNADLVALADTAEVGSVLVTGHQTAGRGS